jgi:hypothetical protein
MILQIKFYCKNQEKGCKQVFTSDNLRKHEAECSYGEEETINITKCKVCNEDGIKEGHYCDNLDKKLCSNHL